MVWVRVIGIVLVILAWLIDKADNFPMVYRVIAPKYFRAMSAFDRIHQAGFVLKESDVGFDEISKIIKERVQGTRETTITQIKTIDQGMGLGDIIEMSNTIRARGSTGPYVEIEVSFANSSSARNKDLRSMCHN